MIKITKLKICIGTVVQIFSKWNWGSIIHRNLCGRNLEV